MGAEPAGWEPSLPAAAFEGTHLIVHEHQLDAIPRIYAMNQKKGPHIAVRAFLFCFLAVSHSLFANALYVRANKSA